MIRLSGESIHSCIVVLGTLEKVESIVARTHLGDQHLPYLIGLIHLTN